MMMKSGKWVYSIWLAAVLLFSSLHFVHLRSDFPDHTPWASDSVKFTDEGWYSSAAVRETVAGHWYLAGDFNPGIPMPVWPFLEWVEFKLTGTSIQAARSLAGILFVADLLLAYALFRGRGSEWASLLGLTFIVTCPFIFCFLRNATLEPILATTILLAMNVAIRAGSSKHPVRASALVGCLFTFMMLAKPMAIFTLPALVVVTLWPLFKTPGLAARCFLSAFSSFALSYGLWLALVYKSGLWHDYRLIFDINVAPVHESFGPVIAVLKMAYFNLRQDYVLVFLAVVLFVVLLLFRSHKWSHSPWKNQAFVGCAVVVLGYMTFAIYENKSPFHISVVGFIFLLLALAQMIAVLIYQPGWPRKVGIIALALSGCAIIRNAAITLGYALHPQYTFQNAADGITRYIDSHPNGNRLLVSTSADNITLYTGLPGMNDHYGTVSLTERLGMYRPGWYAEWNRIGPDTLRELHSRYSLEQVAAFDALDVPSRDHLVLFKLRPHPYVDTATSAAFGSPLPEDKIVVPVVNGSSLPREHIRQRLMRRLGGLLHLQ